MNIRRCEKGHFYDADVHSTCPSCAAGIHPSDSIDWEKSISLPRNPDPNYAN